MDPIIIKKSSLLANLSCSNKGSSVVGKKDMNIKPHHVAIKIIKGFKVNAFCLNLINVRYIINTPKQTPNICIPKIPGGVAILVASYCHFLSPK